MYEFRKSVGRRGRTIQDLTNLPRSVRNFFFIVLGYHIDIHELRGAKNLRKFWKCGEGKSKSFEPIIF